MLGIRPFTLNRDVCSCHFCKSIVILIRWYNLLNIGLLREGECYDADFDARYWISFLQRNFLFLTEKRLSHFILYSSLVLHLRLHDSYIWPAIIWPSVLFESLRFFRSDERFDPISQSDLSTLFCVIDRPIRCEKRNAQVILHQLFSTRGGFCFWLILRWHRAR